ncbi:MAG: peptidylprolyl isomerase [Hyphomicrobiaceae bacterium]|nr:peptidylprolyl isomerase [Hyphomicrobiaceae bacterium]
MVSLLSAAPSGPKASRSRGVRVNGVAISPASIAREAQNHEADTAAEAWLKAARALAVRELLLQEARRTGIVAEPAIDAEGRRETEDEALVRLLVTREVRTPEPSENECRRAFEANLRRLVTPGLCEARHILIAANPQDASARAAARAKAQALAAELTAAPGRFATLAQAHSACPSGRVGGSLGQIGPGQTVPEFEAALARLPVGEVGPEPVETRYGYHVVLVERRVAGHAPSFEMAREAIARWLGARAYHAAVRQYISLLAGKAQIEGVDLEAATSPLVQ